jgi:hypothetical protein
MAEKALKKKIAAADPVMKATKMNKNGTHAGQDLINSFRDHQATTFFVLYTFRDYQGISDGRRHACEGPS